MTELIEHIRSIKQRTAVGVITTLNGTDHHLLNQLDFMEDLVNKNFVNTSVSRRLPTSEDVKRWHQILTGMGEAEMLKDMEATFG